MATLVLSTDHNSSDKWCNYSQSAPKKITPDTEHADARPHLLSRNGETWAGTGKANPCKMASFGYKATAQKISSKPLSKADPLNACVAETFDDSMLLFTAKSSCGLRMQSLFHPGNFA